MNLKNMMDNNFGTFYMLSDNYINNQYSIINLPVHVLKKIFRYISKILFSFYNFCRHYSSIKNQKHKIIFYLTIFITLLITCFILYIGKKFSKKLGTTGLRVIQRIMGLLLMVIAVQFIIDGINNVAVEFINSNF